MLHTETKDDLLRVGGLDALTSLNSAYFKELVKARLENHIRFVEVDCSGLSFMDSVGLGALVSVQKVLTPRDGRVRLLNPRPNLRQLLEMLNFHKLLDIIP